MRVGSVWGVRPSHPAPPDLNRRKKVIAAGDEVAVDPRAVREAAMRARKMELLRVVGHSGGAAGASGSPRRLPLAGGKFHLAGGAVTHGIPEASPLPPPSADSLTPRSPLAGLNLHPIYTSQLHAPGYPTYSAAQLALPARYHPAATSHRGHHLANPAAISCRVLSGEMPCPATLDRALTQIAPHTLHRQACARIRSRVP